MRLVPIHMPGTRPPSCETLSSPEREALIAHFEDGVTQGLNAWLARVWSQRLWIACDCRGSAGTSPVLFVRRAPSDTYVLVRMADRPAHVAACPFSMPPRLRAAKDSMPELSPLPKLFFAWWMAASLNQALPYEASDVLQTHYQALRDVSKSMQLSPGQSLFEFSRQHPQGVPVMLDRLKALATRCNGETYALYATVVADLDSAMLAGEMHQALVHTPFERTSWELPAVETLHRMPPGEGPYLLLARFAATPRAGALRVDCLFAQPIYSARWLVPVDGSVERRTLRSLFDVQRRLAAERVLVRIRKMMPDTAHYDRGVSFAVERLGPHGRALQSVWVASAPCAVDIAAESPDVVYHVRRSRDPSVEESDALFRRELTDALMSRAPNSAPPVTLDRVARRAAER